MEDQLTVSHDPTMHQNNKRNTFQSIFPGYCPQSNAMMSTSQSHFPKNIEFEYDSEYCIHNSDLLMKTFNKKVDREVIYTEAMLRVKNMRGR